MKNELCSANTNVFICTLEKSESRKREEKKAEKIMLMLFLLITGQVSYK